MKTQLLKVNVDSKSSFSVSQDQILFQNNLWHYHPEIELIYFKEGHGTQFIKDNFKPFNSGDVILIGEEIPHCWSFDDAYFDEKQSLKPDACMVHFSERLLGPVFLNLPENQSIKKLIEKAKRGIHVFGKTRKLIGELLEKMLLVEAPERLILLIEALSILSTTDEIEFLSSVELIPSVKDVDNDRIAAVYQYTLANYERQIRIEEIAAVANMSRNSFCRYFKSQTKKTYYSFLREIRIGIACKLLVENKISIKRVCYECGFRNFASFHKYFKTITNRTPMNYQRIYLEKK